MRRLILEDTNCKYVKLGGMSYKYIAKTNYLEIRKMDSIYKYNKFKVGDYIYIDFTQSKQPVGLVMSPNDICKFTMWAMGVPGARRHTQLSSYINERLSVPKTLRMLKPKEELEYAASMAVRDGGRTTVVSMVIHEDYVNSLSIEERNKAIAKVMIDYPKGYNLIPFEHLYEKLKNTFHFSDELLNEIKDSWSGYWSYDYGI